MWIMGLLLAPAHGGVDPFTEADEAELLRAEQTLVTVASRYAQTIRQAPSMVTVITDEQIRQYGHRTLADVLRGISGVYLSVSNESRTLAGVRAISSDDNNKLLLLIDGVPWFDGIYNHAWLDEYIPLSHVKQVEVIKGPGSAIYGSNAFAGVINVVTYSADDLVGGFGRIELGSFARQGLSAVAGGGEAVRLRLHARMLSLDGDGLDVTPRGLTNVTGTNPRRSLSGGLSLQTAGLTVRYDHIDYRHTYFVNPQDDLIGVLTESADEFNLSYADDFLSLRYDIAMGPDVQISPYLYAQRYDNPGAYGWFDSAATVDEDTGEITWGQTLVSTQKLSERYGVGFEGQLRAAAEHITVGGMGVELNHVSQLEDLVFEDGAGTPSRPITFSGEPGWITDVFFFGQHTWTTNWWLELTAGVRMDMHSYTGTSVSPRAGVLIVPDDNGAVKLLYGRAFRAPNARELVVDVVADEDGSNPFTNSNPGLLPEVIETFEGEVSGDPLKNLTLRAASYASWIGDQISKVSDGEGDLGDAYYDNLGGSQITGGEVEVDWTPGRWQIGGNYAMTLATDVDTGNSLYEFPVHMGHLRAGGTPVPGLWIGLQADLYGARPRADWSPDAGLEDGAPFGLLHLSLASDSLGDSRVRIDLSIHNLLNAEYETLIPAGDANALTTDDDGGSVAKFPSDLTGEGRAAVLGLEVDF
ncbi:MAG: outer membrane receptor protein involved in Fe transport [Myxococcota bacterium]|jgi:outer membrane receptor protein involved in Fe transport